MIVLNNVAVFSAKFVRKVTFYAPCRQIITSSQNQKALKTQVDENGTSKTSEDIYGQPSHRTHPHLLKAGELVPGVPVSEFQQRRFNLLKLISGSTFKNGVKNLFQGKSANKHIIIIPSATKQFMSEKIPYVFRQNSDFLYLTGCLEQDCTLVLSGESESNFTSTIFMREKDKHSELWDGPRTGSELARHLFGVDESLPVSEFAPYLSSQMSSNPSNTLWYDSSISVQPSIQSTVLALMKHFQVQVTESPRNPLHQLRVIKSEAEQKLMKESCRIGSRSIEKTMAWTKPGITEHELFAKVDFESRIGGAEYLAYPPVVATGNNCNVIHYIENKQKSKDGDLILMDAGCEYHGYASDITRTWPVSGKFSPQQRILYEIVYEVQSEILSFCQNHHQSLDNLFHSMCHLLGQKLKLAGVFAIESNAQEVLAKMAHELCPHHVSHYLGMDVHDVCTVPRTIALQPGMVITVEPGLYINKISHLARPEFRGIGIRIEDDVLITDSGYEVLTQSCPKHPDDIEKIVSYQKCLDEL